MLLAVSWDRLCWRIHNILYSQLQHLQTDKFTTNTFDQCVNKWITTTSESPSDKAKPFLVSNSQQLFKFSIFCFQNFFRLNFYVDAFGSHFEATLTDQSLVLFGSVYESNLHEPTSTETKCSITGRPPWQIGSQWGFSDSSQDYVSTFSRPQSARHLVLKPRLLRLCASSFFLRLRSAQGFLRGAWALELWGWSPTLVLADPKDPKLTRVLAISLAVDSDPKL